MPRSTQHAANSLRTQEFQRYDGWYNNRGNPKWGSVDEMVVYEITASTETSCPLEIVKIPVAVDDKAFNGNGTVTGIPFTRGKYDKTTGKGFDCPREQVNERTAWIDASFVYSATEAWVASMRSFENGTFKEGSEQGWNAQDVVQEYSVDEFILGMVSQVSEAEDVVVVEDLRGT
ncbi:hypothetical protein TELCIR_04307 [Teladorsagia circumcincta]|uniref:Uncharacterized protein n=1 Tax=Teladorsagia circumcincta TaxID=45464 RepID=A0A2G9UVG5_TELCI|nr:hypothetical protein TELCIR_04307 [Teladorsagia circumcincta]